MLFKKKSLRHQAVVDEPATRREPLWKFNPWQVRVAFGIAGFFALAMLIGFIPQQLLRVEPLGRIRQNILSPVDFSVPDNAALKTLRQQARLHTPSILVPIVHQRMFAHITRDLSSLPRQVSHLSSVAVLPADFKALYGNISAEALAWLGANAHGQRLAAYQAAISQLIKDLQSHPIVTPADFKQIAAGASADVMLGANSSLVSLNRIGILEPGGGAFAPLIDRLFPQDIRPCLLAYFSKMGKPTFQLDRAATARLADQNAAKIVAPMLTYHRGEVLIQAGRIETSADQALLEAARSSYLRQLTRDHPWAQFFGAPGRAALLLLMTLIAALYVLGHERELRSITRTAAFGVLMLIAMFIPQAAVLLGFAHLTFLLGIAPLLLVTIIFSIAADRRLAWGLAVINALLIAWVMNRGFPFFITALAGVTVFTFGLGEIRARSILLKTALFAAMAMAVGLWATRMGAGVSMRTSSMDWRSLTFRANGSTLQHELALTVLASLAAAFVALGLLPLIEKAFHCATSMTLLELADTNRPLLRRMAIEAPGTFNHSLIMGIMAESAGRAIGADSLLCRVGAYYHDIGKLVKPEYFIENMAGNPNRHDKLAPSMSHLIVIGHVKDGIELAREFRLPSQVCNFIAEHHGTTVVEVFFNAARDRQAKQALTGGVHSQVTENDFRYPGPKPQSRETAIVMICDAVESLVRSMQETTAGRIESAAHQLILKRLLDGQFDRCDLTLADLTRIEQSILRTLAGVYHGRLAYPKPLAISRPA